jgi:hypothetical protein
MMSEMASRKRIPLFAAPCEVARRGLPPTAAGAASDDGLSRRTPLKTAGGTEGLLRRSNSERPARPCPRAALSGRRAAQDGQLAALGGPERASMGRSGEMLSAGRVDAPDRLPLGTLGRGHSAARVTATPKATVEVVVP